MKRFFFWFMVGMIAIGIVRSNHHRARALDESPRSIVINDSTGSGSSGSRSGRTILVVERDGRRILIDNRGVHVNSRKAHDHHESSSTHDVDDLDRDHAIEQELERSLAQAETSAQRVVVEGLPVPVVPGSLTVEARPEPPRPPEPPKPPKPPRAPKRIQATKPIPPRAPEPKPELVVIKGRRSATEPRARQDARNILEERVSEWLEPEVPKSWKPSAGRIDRLIRETQVSPIERDYGTVYEAELKVDLSRPRRDQIVGDYRHEQTLKKLGLLGAGLGFVLVCLASLSGYIRADEATKGYYTNRLRLATAVGVGAAGVALYRWLA